MVDRPNKPTALAATPSLPPQPQVTTSDDKSRVTAVLPTGESVEVLLYGATVISWKDAAGAEKLWLSDAAKLDGTKAVRGGIPLVFPVFGKSKDHPPTSKLPQHGFARTSTWEFLNSSKSESATGETDTSVILDFSLSSANLDKESAAMWPYTFDLRYSVGLSPSGLTTSMVITNTGTVDFDCQVLMHTYLRIDDINTVEVTGLEESSYTDKVDVDANQNPKTKTSPFEGLTFTGETDRVYTPAKGPSHAIIVKEKGKKIFSIVRRGYNDVVVWNPWTGKAVEIGDFEPKDGFNKMLCIEAGSVADWQKLGPEDSLEGGQTISYD